MENQSNKDTRTAKSNTSQTPCHYGWNCHNRENGKCQRYHIQFCSWGWKCRDRENGKCQRYHIPNQESTNNDTGTKASSSPSVHDAETKVSSSRAVHDAETKASSSPSVHDAETKVSSNPTPKKSKICDHGWECRGRKNGKCPYTHINPVPCRWRWDCRGRQNGTCSYTHTEESSTINEV
jgi:hypothetical protein